MKCRLLIVILSGVSWVRYAQSASMETQPVKKLHVFAVPGQNGGGSGLQYIHEVLGEGVKVTTVGIPRAFSIDLGQERCIRYLEEAVAYGSAHNGDDQYKMLYATSQGTATSLNYLSQVSSKQKWACVFEACMASGNSAILHTVGGRLMDMPWLANLPFAYHWVPYLAKVFFPFYSPTGIQPIKSAQNIKNQGPFIIIHSQDDPQLAFTDACALYHVLKKNNNTVYFIAQEGEAHLEILHSNEYMHSVVRAILKKEGLPIEGENAGLCDKELKGRYQPDYMKEEYRGAYESLQLRERMHSFFQSCVLTVAGAYAGIACHRLMSGRPPIG